MPSSDHLWAPTIGHRAEPGRPASLMNALSQKSKLIISTTRPLLIRVHLHDAVVEHVGAVILMRDRDLAILVDESPPVAGLGERQAVGKGPGIVEPWRDPLAPPCYPGVPGSTTRSPLVDEAPLVALPDEGPVPEKRRPPSNCRSTLVVEGLEAPRLGLNACPDPAADPRAPRSRHRLAPVQPQRASPAIAPSGASRGALVQAVPALASCQSLRSRCGPTSCGRRAPGVGPAPRASRGPGSGHARPVRHGVYYGPVVRKSTDRADRDRGNRIPARKPPRRRRPPFTERRRADRAAGTA